jgi:small subunit ribosomal protein S8
MVLLDPLSDALSAIANAEARNLKECTVSPASNLIANVLRAFQKYSYVGEFEYIEDGKAGKLKVQLLGRINKCRSIRPRHHVKAKDIPKWEHLLPAYNRGIIVISTTQGIVSHKQAIESRLGGRLIAYVY